MNAHNPPVEGNTSNLAGDVITLMHDLLRWQEQIEAAMAHVDNQYTFNDIVASIMRGERHFYKYDRCCVIMQFEEYPAYSIYHCFVACGEMQAIKDAEKDMNERAKALGCKYMAISGRVGWPRALKNDGWKHVLSIMYKETY
jgi:hypothetical protein